MKQTIASVMLMATLFISFVANAQNKADDIMGIWLTTGKEPAKIQIYRTGEKFYGKIIWLQNPIENGKQKVDVNNPDKTKQNNLVIGLIILKAFTFDGREQWKGGEIYDPESGKTYRSFMSLKNNQTLKVRGYVGISLLGRTETWTRTN
jgi:uncharacterized protein (DUF2147 family)